jgi:uncharacterized protein YjbJ (UPF0337 family)
MSDMESKKDEIKGRVKEAAGDLTDNDEMKRDGKADRIGATVKEKANDIVDKAKDVLDGDK